MYIQSMTGYGRGVCGNFMIEVRSSNHRNLEIRTNVPPYLYPYESKIRNIIKEKFQRGRIEIFIPKHEESSVKLKINKSLAKEYYNAFVSLKDELSISDEIGINLLASQREIFYLEESEIEFSAFCDALEAALEDLRKGRRGEGKNLSDDITMRTQTLYSQLTYIENKRVELVTAAKVKLTEKLQDLLGSIQIDDTRIIQEVAILVERSDITEEIVRIKSHLKHIEEILVRGGVAGKKIDFFAQELHRELNTIGSKAAFADISAMVVEMKHETEKIREQTQNLQ